MPMSTCAHCVEEAVTSPVSHRGRVYQLCRSCGRHLEQRGFLPRSEERPPRYDFATRTKLPNLDQLDYAMGRQR